LRNYVYRHVNPREKLSMPPKILRTYRTLSESIGVPEKTLRAWARARKIPCIRMGWRTVYFDEDRVRAALSKFTVNAIGE
jgi:hypothetical protein